MSVETADYIAELNPNWPEGPDYINEGDDHIRVTKRATQQTWPNMDAACTVTPSELNQFAGRGNALIVGEVRMFAGAVVPDGWLACNGAAIPAEHTALIALVGPNAPDLRGQFIRGWSEDNGIDPNGPRAPLTGQQDAFKAHYHSGASHHYGDQGGLSSGGYYGNNFYRYQFSDGGGGPETRPKNITLMFIIKT